MSSTDRSYNEKRDFIRMRINSTVNIHHQGSEFKGVCKDLSGAGMLVEADQTLDTGSEVTITIEQKSETLLPFNASAEVTRTETGKNGKYIIGLSIKEIHEE